jgi:putative signal transducing protein
MSYCQNCRLEYGENVTHCKKCGATLLPGVTTRAASLQRGSGEVTCVRMFNGPTAQMDSEVARTLLEQEGIQCQLSGGHLAELRHGFMEGISLLVLGEDADEAAEILQDFFDSPQPLAPDEPSA